MRKKEEIQKFLDGGSVEVVDSMLLNDGFIGVMARINLNGLKFAFIASNGEGWEHVSISTPVRYPTWNEMNFFKNVFWDSDECVMQLHPPETEYVNNHKYCLHLWKPLNAVIPMPPTNLVGINGKNSK